MRSAIITFRQQFDGVDRVAAGDDERSVKPKSHVNSKLDDRKMQNRTLQLAVGHLTLRGMNPPFNPLFPSFGR